MSPVRKGVPGDVRQRRHRADLNESQIVDALRAVGATVYRIGEPVDLLVGYHNRAWLMEVKSEGGKLRPAQEQCIRTWRGGPVVVVFSVADALQAIGIPVRDA